MKRLFVAAVTALSLHAIAADSPDIAAARELLDSYYGNAVNLEKARARLEKAMATDPRSAELYVEAARLAVMGGYIVGKEFQPGTIEAYDAFLDKALAIDPRLPKTYILKSEVHNTRGNADAEKAALDKAQELGTKDPWLWFGYGRYYASVGQLQPSMDAYAKVVASGPGKTTSDRRAYVAALEKMASFNARIGSPNDVLKYAAMIRRERNPSDAWSLGNTAGLFNRMGRFDDGIDFAREALRVMDYGSARLQLAVGLYGKAAQSIQAHDRAKALVLTTEADALKVPRERVMSSLGRGEHLQALTPILQAIVK